MFQSKEFGTLRIEFEQEKDGRWIAEVPALPGLLFYGATDIEARSRANRFRTGRTTSLPPREPAARRQSGHCPAATSPYGMDVEATVRIIVAIWVTRLCLCLSQPAIKSDRACWHA